MTRYFFHLYDDETLCDEEGAEYPDLEAARAAATLEVLYQAAEAVRTKRHLVLSHRLSIHDSTGEVASVRFGDVIEVRE